MPRPNDINPKTGKRYAWEAEQRALKSPENADIRKQLELLKRQQVAVASRDKFMTFIKFTSPDPEDPNDVEKSKYKNARHHDAVARVLEAMIKGEVDYTFLILTLPPRHGKSEQVSRRLPAWLMGLFPDQNGVVATYNDDFASDFGKDVRTIMQSPQYKQVFPGSALKRGGGASDRLQTVKGGQWSFVGRGGSLTGRGAHCFPAGTMVETSDGPVPIEQVTVSHKVLSYDVRNKRIVWKSVQAVARRPKARLYRVSSTSGRVVEATSDHRFFANGRWVEAGQLTPGDRLLRAVRQVSLEDGLRPQKAPVSGAPEFLLFSGMLEPGDQRTEARFSGVRSLRNARASEGIVRSTGAREHLLLGRVHGAGAGGAVRSARTGEDEALRKMQRDVHAGELDDEVLQQAVRVESTCRANGEGREPALEGWSSSEPRETACDTPLPRAAAYGDETRRIEVRPLRGEHASGGTPHRRGSAEQSRYEFGDPLPAVSRGHAFFSGEDDFVASVEDTRRDADVFDIQVEETECFFANGILVHNCLICDDLIKDDKEAQSQAIRDQAWNWFTKVAMSRRMGRKIVILTFTRWHNDDPIGRLIDPENPHYNAKIAAKIKIINIPAIAEDDDPIGRKPGEALWPDGPDKFDLDFLEEQKSLDPLGFAALYQQRPSLLDGDLYRRENIQFYKPGELPEDLRIYGASDHAVATGQRNDFTVLLKFGVDKQSNIYLLECFWRKAKSDIVVEAFLEMGRGNMKPLVWWAEKGHISKAIGPFLRKRMHETGVYMNIREITPTQDKASRAQSMIGRVAMGKLFFPKDAIWTEKAIAQMMAFPSGTHDDFVDTLSLIGLGMQSQFAPAGNSDKKKIDTPKFGTLAWVKLADKWASEQKALTAAGGF